MRLSIFVVLGHVLDTRVSFLLFCGGAWTFLSDYLYAIETTLQVFVSPSKGKELGLKTLVLESDLL